MRDDQFYTGPSGVGRLRSLTRAVPVLVPVPGESESPWGYYLVMGCEMSFPLRTASYVLSSTGLLCMSIVGRMPKFESLIALPTHTCILFLQSDLSLKTCRTPFLDIYFTLQDQNEQCATISMRSSHTQGVRVTIASPQDDFLISVSPAALACIAQTQSHHRRR